MNPLWQLNVMDQSGNIVGSITHTPNNPLLFAGDHQALTEVFPSVISAGRFFPTPDSVIASSYETFRARYSERYGTHLREWDELLEVHPELAAQWRAILTPDPDLDPSHN